MKSFSQVTRADLQQSFGISIIQERFVPNVSSIELPSWLDFVLESRRGNLAIFRSEKAISEAIIAPLLMAVQHLFVDKIKVFSGEPMATDELSGICDFLITKDPKALDPQGGYFILVEAKKQDLLSGVPQCVAEMYAAKVLNGNDDTVYGCVSTGLEWLFIKLEDKIAFTDPNIFGISEAQKILGVFGWLVGLE